MNAFRTLFTLSCIFNLSAVSAQQGNPKVLLAETNIRFHGANLPITGDSTAFTYNNAFNKNATQIWYLVDGTDDWELTTRLTNYNYSPAGDLLSVIEQYLEQGVWVNASRYVYTYDTQHRMLSYKYSSWSGTSWYPPVITTFEYDANGNLITESLGSDVRHIYTYDNQNLLQSRLITYLLNGTWENSDLDQYEYVQNETNVSSKTSFYWYDSMWNNEERFIYAYDAYKNLSTVTLEVWEESNWKESDRNKYTYDGNFKLILDTQQQMKKDVWEDYRKNALFYNPDGSLRLSRWEYRFMNVWDLQSISRYHYGELSGTNTISNAVFNLYPNPASDEIMISGENLAQVSIFDLQGRPAFHQNLKVSGTSFLQLGHLIPGSYVVQVQDKTGKTGVKSLQIRR